jgi:hypothetical protein
MPTKQKNCRVKSPRKKVEARPSRRARQSVPDLRDPRIVADLRREGRLLAQHPENDAIDDWIEAVYDDSDWK